MRCLSERQQRILLVVAEEYLRTGKPIGSKAIAERDDVEWGASTVRNELAALERRRLSDPSAHLGRPDADRPRLPLLRRLAAGDGADPARAGAPSPELDLTRMRREVEDAMRETTQALSQMTDLLAVATAPPPSAARVHRVEVLQLQPRWRWWS